MNHDDVLDSIQYLKGQIEAEKQTIANHQENLRRLQVAVTELEKGIGW